MKPPDKYARDGFLAHLIMTTQLPNTETGRERHLALYKREKNGRARYEVVVLAWVDSTLINSNKMEARLALPSSSQWGKTA